MRVAAALVILVLGVAIAVGLFVGGWVASLPFRAAAAFFKRAWFDR